MSRSTESFFVIFTSLSYLSLSIRKCRLFAIFVNL